MAARHLKVEAVAVREYFDDARKTFTMLVEETTLLGKSVSKVQAEVDQISASIELLE